jgi:two-component system invasion response regulator UvrY
VENLFAEALYFGDTGEFEKKRNLTGEIHTPSIMISVALADDHLITRTGIKTILQLHKFIKVETEASNGIELLDKLSRCEILPDIAIIDITMPLMNGFDTVKELHKLYPSIKVIAFSLIYEEDAVINMITLGACGYIPKSADPSLLAEAVFAVHEKGFYLGELVKKEYFNTYNTLKKRPAFTGKQLLTQKEVAFIKLAATNLNYKEIADIMEVSPKTVENYRDSLFVKLEIKNRAALALYGFKNGLVTFS